MYQLTAVQKWYGPRCVLKIEELQVQQGEILALIGPSGAGKSTLLRLLNFLEQPTQGDILFAGAAETAVLPLAQRRRITMVLQRPLLLRRSVRANLRYGLKLRGVRLAADTERFWLERLGLTAVADQSADKLSAGEAQRVALARALLLQPDVLLLDEPTANLDPYNVGLIESIISEINSQSGITVVLVTHNIFQARRIAQRTALLFDGELVEVGATERLFTQPEKVETAAFLRGDIAY